MSECVVRMDMPENCECCPMVFTADVPGYHWCAALEQEVEQGFSRPKECPIICQLPEGHGDLVDWKDVEKELDKSFCSVVDDGPCMGPYMLKRKEYPQALIERPIRVNIIVPAERSET